MKLWNSRRLITAALTLALVTVASVSWGQGLVGGGTLSIGSKDLAIRKTGTGYANKFRNGSTGNLIGTKSWADSSWVTHKGTAFANVDTTAWFNPARDLPDWAIGFRSAAAVTDSFWIFTLVAETGSDGPQTTTSHGTDYTSNPVDSVFVTMQVSHDGGATLDGLPTVTVLSNVTSGVFKIYNSQLFSGSGLTNATFMAGGANPLFRFIIGHGDGTYPIAYRLAYPQFNR